jgi:hypothetical protein
VCFFLIIVQGRWGPGSKEWKTDVGREIISKLSRSARVDNVDGGTFWMEFSQFVQYFDIIHYCRTFDNMTSQQVNAPKITFFIYFAIQLSNYPS